MPPTSRGRAKGDALAIEFLNESGKVTGKSKPLTGDAVDTPVEWEQSPDFTRGVTQLRFSIKNADMYSFRFQ